MFSTLKTHVLGWLKKSTVVCAFALTATSSLEGAISWQPPLDVTQSGGNTVGMQVAPYTDGRAIAVWSWFNGTNYVIQSSLIKNSGSWTKPVTISTPGADAFFPQISVDSKGNAIAIWAQKNSNNILVIQAANKPRNGIWGQPSNVSINDNRGDATLPQIAFNKKGKAHAVWQKKCKGRWIIQYATKPEASSMLGNWSKPKGLSSRMTSGTGTIQPQLSVDPAGDIYVVWNNASRETIEAICQVANKNWGAIRVISNPNVAASSPQLASDNNGNAVALWNAFDGSNWIIQSATHLFKGSWCAPTTVSLPGEDSSFPALAVDNMGNATAAWQTMQGDFSVIQTAFLPFGGSWSSPTNLTTPDQDATEARVATGTNNTEIIVWKRSDGTNFVIQAATGVLGGNWSSPTTLSHAGQDAVTPQVAADNFGAVTVTWMRSDGANAIGQAAYGVSTN